MKKRITYLAPLSVLMAILFGLNSTIFGQTNKYVFPVKKTPKAHSARINAVKYLMSLSEAEMISIVPKQSGLYYTDCPNCDKDLQGHANWQWEPQIPDQIKCKGCDAVYPDNPMYPDDEYIAVESPDGQHRYNFYKRPDGYRIFFRAHADYMAADYMVNICRDFAELYLTTEDEQYARRAALIIIRFSEVYPGYAYKFDYPLAQKKFSPYTQNRIKGVSEFRTTRWKSWAYSDISRELLRAYDILRFWPGFDKMSDGKARLKIEKDLFTNMVESVMSLEEPYSNMSPCMWGDFINAGRVLGKPEWIKETINRLDTFTSTYFLYDNYWKEASPSYCKDVMKVLEKVLLALKGYDIPADITSETASFIRTNKEKNTVFLSRLKQACDSILLPNKRYPTINDTWAHTGSLRKSTKSLLMPALGLSILGGGEDEYQIYAWLNFTSGRAHKHKDDLSIGLFAFNNELLRDIGYTHTKWRAWTQSTMSHNTVVINGLEGKFDDLHTKHKLRIFATDNDSFHLAEADSDSAYPGIAKRYRRTYLLVGSDSRDAYLIDIFQVHGGMQHDYLIHGSAAEDSVAKITGANMRPFDGTLMNSGVEFKYPTNEYQSVGQAGGFGFITDISAGPASPNIILDLRLESKPQIGTSSHILCYPATTVYLGKAPRIRQAKRRNDLLSSFNAPVFCARREGKDLRSVFVAVHEPVNGVSKVDRITSKLLDGGILVTIDRGQKGSDYFVMAFDDAISTEVEIPEGYLRFEGRWGLACMRSGKLDSAHIVEGKLLAINGEQITGVSGWQGDIRKVNCSSNEYSGGYFEIEERISPANAGAVVILEFADSTIRAYNIARMEILEKGTRLYVVENPGYAVTTDGIELVTYPQRIIKGKEVHYRFPGVTHMKARQ